jgi:hypothetical protein
VLREKRITTGLENAQLPFVIDFWREMAKLEVHIVGVADPDEVAISLKGENLTLFEALTLALEPHGLGFEVRETILVITPKHQISAPRHNAPLWSPAAESARIEALLEALSSRDPAARRKAEQDFLGLGEASLEALGEAARLLDLPQASQARALRERILEERKLWLLDSGSGARAQALTDGQKRLLEGKVTCSVRAVQAGEFLASTAKTLGVKLDVRTAPPRAVTLTLQEVPLGALLRALTLPHGLDFYLDGDTIVVDTAANVRAAVEK